MARHSQAVISKSRSREKPKTDICVFCETSFEVKTSYKHMAPHICPKCRLSRPGKWAAQFRPAEGSNLKSAYTRLFLAIKRSAVAEGKLETWKRYWVDSPVMKRIWDLLQQEVQRQKTASSGSVDRSGNTSYI
jgi:molybdenum cofactor biosynthesis enzyme MoaA